MKWRVWTLAGTLAATACAVFLLPRIPQSETYHAFADQRTLPGIPRCLDVISNVPFVIFGTWGILFVTSATPESRFIESRERWPYFVFFLGVTLTGFGSAYYHLQPNDSRLVWDRVPMTIGFTALVAAVISERINVTAGLRLLAPLLAFGIAGVWYWHLTQAAGHGDLRAYAFVQFGSLLAILGLIASLPPRNTRGRDFVVSLGIYALAKACEAADKQIFALGKIVSGHTLKHVVAAISAYWILRMLQLRRSFSNAAETVVRLGPC